MRKQKKQRRCKICMCLYTPSAPNQLYCNPPCSNVAKKLLSLKRDIQRDAAYKARRIDNILGR